MPGAGDRYPARVPAPDECIVVIPCLNEAATIAGVVSGARRHVPRVIVVDDGSTDDTAGRAREAGATIRRHARPMGKASAIRTGMHAAREAGAGWAVLMDGDGQHDPADIPALLEAVDRTGADMVIGNRMDEAGKIPWIRRLVNRWMSRDLSRWTGMTIPDTQCGFRVVRLATWESIQPRADGFLMESAMIVAAARAGASIAHAPVGVLPRSAGASRIRVLRDVARWAAWRARLGRRPMRRRGDAAN